MVLTLDTNYFGNTLLQYMIFFGIIIASIVIGRIIYFVSKNIIRKKAKKTKTMLDDILVESIEKPIVFLIVILGIVYGLKTLTLSVGVEETFSNITSILLTLNLFWFGIVFIDALIVQYLAPMASRSKSDLNEALLPIIRKLVKIALTMIAIIVVIDNFGYDVTSIIAGLGIGGLAFAFAAKDMLANLFGGASILGDKPFRIGDRIKVENYDGWVREVGMRSTRVETLDGFQLVVPNSIIANSILENVSKEVTRKVKLTIGVEYGTSMKKMEQAKAIIHDIVKKNKDVKNKSIVSFVEFADSSLNFLIIYWIDNLDKILDTKHAINMEIKKQFEKVKIEMAFPTTTVHLKK